MVMVTAIISLAEHTNLTIARGASGTLYRDVFGCLDSDNDGTSDTSDPCPYDPEIFEGRIGSVVCQITEPQQDGEAEIESSTDSDQPTLVYLGIAIVALLSVIIVAQFSKTMAKRKESKTRKIR